LLEASYGAVEYWTKKLTDTFPKTAAGIQHAQIDFDRGRESKLQRFTTDYMLEYDSPGLHPVTISKVSFGHLGRLLCNIFSWWGHLGYATMRNLLLNFQLIV
jgi:hypothetical protein